MKSNIIIIGITGTLGAGKGVIVDHLKEEGFQHFSVSGFLADKVKERGLPVNRDTLVAMGNELRTKHSPGYLAEQLYTQAEKCGKSCIIESLRTVGEIEILKQKSSRFLLFAVDADPKFRYQWIKSRGSDKDNISFEEFLANEERELKSDDPNKQNLTACIAMADFTFINDGTVDDLKLKVEMALSDIAEQIFLKECDDR